MLTVCPSCRHTFQTADVHSQCCSGSSKMQCPVIVSATIRLPPTICPSAGINCTVNINHDARNNFTAKAHDTIAGSCLSERNSIRNTPSGGKIIYADKVKDRAGDQKSFGGNSLRISTAPAGPPVHAQNSLTITTVAGNESSNEPQKKKVLQDLVSPTSRFSFVIPQSSATNISTSTSSGTASSCNCGNGSCSCSNNSSYWPSDLDRLLKKKTVVSNLFSSSELDLQRLCCSLNYLQLSGWYHRGLSWKDSIILLSSCDVGTFLVRDSSDSQFLYSLSIQTRYGPTSIRIYYYNGKFRLDAEPKVAGFMPRFPCVLDLIQYYVESTKSEPLKCFHNDRLLPVQQKQVSVWTPDDDDGDYCNGMSAYSYVTLEKPLYVKSRFPSLKHLSRLAVNRYHSKQETSSLPTSVIAYLQQYPYKY